VETPETPPNRGKEKSFLNLNVSLNLWYFIFITIFAAEIEKRTGRRG